MNGAGPLTEDIVHCRACGAEIVFVRTKAGKRMPVNVVPTDKKHRAPNAGELEFVYGEHQSHFMTCPQADAFRR